MREAGAVPALAVEDRHARGAPLLAREEAQAQQSGDSSPFARGAGGTVATPSAAT